MTNRTNKLRERLSRSDESIELLHSKSDSGKCIQPLQTSIISIDDIQDSATEHNTIIDSFSISSGNSDLRGDRGSIALLTSLYVLQGIPLGLAASIPYLLQSRKVGLCVCIGYT